MIYSSRHGHQASPILASTSAVRGGAGYGFQEVPISYTFVAGASHVLNRRPADGVAWAGSTGLMRFEDSGLPRTVGPVTLLDGTEGFTAEVLSNRDHPNLRIDVVNVAISEPAGAALVAYVLALLALRRRTA